MNSRKWGAVAIYLVLAIWGFTTASEQVAQVITWVFLGLAGVHILEFLLVFRLLQSAPGSLAGHFLHTFLFGFVHWLPIKQQES